MFIHSRWKGMIEQSDRVCMDSSIIGLGLIFWADTRLFMNNISYLIEMKKRSGLNIAATI